MAQEQAQATKQQTITYNDSLELVSVSDSFESSNLGDAFKAVSDVAALLFVCMQSVFHISYLRGLFPDGHFKGVDMTNLDGMNIKMLQANCDESRRLIDWVEGGVYDAIRRGYLKTLLFGIALDPQGQSLLEEYIFNFVYSREDGVVSMDMVQRNGQTGAKQSLHRTDGRPSAGNTVDQVKYQVTRLMRMLVQICQTLDKVPHERFLFMKLKYHDHTPDEYEPPYFIPVDAENAAGIFPKEPFQMLVGKVSTNYHGLTMKVKSALDCCDEGDAGMEVPEDMASAGARTPMSTGGGRTPGRGPLHSHASHSALVNNPTDSPAPEVTQYHAIHSYVTRCFEKYDHLDMADAISTFLDISATVMERIFLHLTADGILVQDPAHVDRYLPGAKIKPHKDTQDARHAADKLAGKLAEQLGVAGDGSAKRSGVSQAGRDTEPVRQTRAQKAAFSAAVAATGQDTVMTRAGPELNAEDRTQHLAAAAAPDDVRPTSKAHPQEGKRSGAQKPRSRKASYVADPIYQRPPKETKKARRGS